MRLEKSYYWSLLSVKCPRQDDKSFTIRALESGNNTNIYCQRGIAAVNLSTNMRNIHSVNETIAIADLEKMLEILKRMIQEIE